jgi:hypothetical protein
VGDGTRAYGRVQDHALLQAMETEEWVARPIHLETGETGVNLVRG